MYNKKTFLLGLLIACTSPAMAQYHVVGDVTGVADGTLVYLTLVKSEHENIDSTIVKNGHFEFKGGCLQGPQWALIKKKGSFVATCDFYLENGEITIKGGTFDAVATGTPTNAEYNEYKTQINAMGNTLYTLNLESSLETDEHRRDSLKTELKKTQLLQRQREFDFIRRYPASPISFRIVEDLSISLSSAEVLKIIGMLSVESQQNERVRQVKSRAEQLAKVEAGAVAPDFTLPTDKGGKQSLSSYKGKYVMIDFWASWCGPCRASFPAIVKLNDEYDKRLIILGVSLDRSEAAWRKALAEEKCTWTQVWDGKGEVAKTYAVSAIPLLVLVGPDGKIIGRYSKADITEELKKLLE